MNTEHSRTVSAHQPKSHPTRRYALDSSALELDLDRAATGSLAWPQGSTHDTQQNKRHRSSFARRDSSIIRVTQGSFVERGQRRSLLQRLLRITFAIVILPHSPARDWPGYCFEADASTGSLIRAEAKGRHYQSKQVQRVSSHVPIHHLHRLRLKEGTRNLFPGVGNLRNGQAGMNPDVSLSSAPSRLYRKRRKGGKA